MNLWLITTGSSDVQIKDNDLWNEWYPEIKRSLYDADRKDFKPTRTIDDDGVPYRIAPRVLGLAHEKLGDAVSEQLTFPLLQEFQRKLEQEQVAIAQIFILITDQGDVFDEDERSSYHCPYWQDTCLLFPILKTYLQSSFPDAQITPLRLQPTSAQQGLDNWNEVLTLVQQELGALTIDPVKVYVSHQAGTPAISSAVQFSSLAKFGDRVHFLVSNEYKPELTGFVESSSYLRGIRIQEARALLKRYAYSSVRQTLQPHLSDNATAKHIKHLLDASEQWNFAEFHKFKKILVDRQLLVIKDFPWYQAGYESAYLAYVRYEQGNTVDALFHSFRAIEGTIVRWAEKRFKSHITQRTDKDYNPSRGTQIRISICTELPEFFDALSKGNQRSFKEFGTLGLFGTQLYELLKKARPEWETHPDIKTVWEITKDYRNNGFHRIEGLREEEVFQAWDTSSVDSWKNRVLGCLNFIAQEDLVVAPLSLETASLMTKVHEELEQAISQL